MKKTIIILAIISSIISSSHQIQNLCGNDPSITHVADPSNCHLFIECDRSRGFVVPKSGSCYDTGANFVFTDANKNVWCTTTDNHCSDPLWACPPETENDIMVADPFDPNCQRHRQCRNLSGNFTQCSIGLYFNRNTGLCDFWSNAPCERVPLPVRCPAGYTGFYPGFLCYQYVYCQNGEILLRLECNEGMYFSQSSGSCLYGNCPRSKTMSKDFLISN